MYSLTRGATHASADPSAGSEHGSTGNNGQPLPASNAVAAAASGQGWAVDIPELRAVFTRDVKALHTIFNHYAITRRALPGKGCVWCCCAWPVACASADHSTWCEPQTRGPSRGIDIRRRDQNCTRLRVGATAAVAVVASTPFPTSDGGGCCCHRRCCGHQRCRWKRAGRPELPPARGGAWPCRVAGTGVLHLPRHTQHPHSHTARLTLPSVVARCHRRTRSSIPSCLLVRPPRRC